MKTLRAAIFDLDGVVLDTESQYSVIWGRIGQLFHPEIPDFAQRIKGMTLLNIFNEWFPSQAVQAEVTRMLYAYEADEMKYDYIAGAERFLRLLRANGIPVALATSSNMAKMEDVRRTLPSLFDLFDQMVTSEKVSHSKPHPECFVLAAQLLGVSPSVCAVFEDSVNGLRAARASGAYVVGLTTTNPIDVVEPLADFTIADFDDPELNSLIFSNSKP